MSQYPGMERRRTLTPEQKRRILQKRRRRRLKRRLMIIVPVAVVLIVLIIVLSVTLGGKQDKVSKPEAVPAAAMVEATPQAADVSANQMPENATAAPQATQAPAQEGFIFREAYKQAVLGNSSGRTIAINASKIDAAKMSRWNAPQEGYLPIVTNANTDEKIIAITVDDCFQGNNFMRIVQCAVENNSKLTIFPIGDNLTDEDVANALRYAHQNGMEIENHTYNHVGMYKYDDNRMTDEMWYQNMKVNEVLGVNYQQHFFRPRGGDERKDQRVHAYASQIGMYGIAIWSHDGSNSSSSGLVRSLAPGNIYLFHTTDKDLKLLLNFIPAAVEQGYRLVTMNEMFGLPENETSQYTPDAKKPNLEPFKVIPMNMTNPSYANAVFPVQERLIELGWMEGEATGMYGDQSFMAAGFFQMAAGLDADGIAGIATQSALFSDSAPRGSKEQIQAYCNQLGIQMPTQAPAAS